MRKALVIVFLSVLLSPLAHAKTAGLDSTKVDNSFDFQNTPVWCWAATIQMALRYYGFDITQPEIVQRTFGAVIPTTGNWIQMTQNLNYLGTAPNGRNVLISANVYFGSPSAEAIINHLKQKSRSSWPSTIRTRSRGMQYWLPRSIIISSGTRPSSLI